MWINQVVLVRNSKKNEKKTQKINHKKITCIVKDIQKVRIT